MTKYFKETTARKDWLLSCGHLIKNGETYWRCNQETMCEICKEEIEDRMSDEWWSGLWAFADVSIKEYAETYGRASDYEQVLMEDYVRQNPSIVFVVKRRRVLSEKI